MPPLPTDKQNRAQILYRQGRYNEALQLFNSIIDKWPSPSLSVYDNRAATLLKLGQLEDALADAKTMMKIAKTEVAGYLRAGQIMGKLSRGSIRVIAIYEYGLKYVEDESGRNMLIGVMEKISNDQRNKAFEARRKDLLLALPLELAEMILEYLSFKEFVRLIGVCKGWRAFLTGCPRFWRNLNFIGAQKPVKFNAVRSYSRWAKHGVKEMTIFRPDIRGKGDSLSYVVGACKELESIIIMDGITNQTLRTVGPRARNLTTIKIYSETTLDLVAELFEKCPNLLHGEFHCVVGSNPDWRGDLSRMETLHLVGQARSNSAWDVLPVFLNLDRLLSHFPGLRDLTLSRLSGRGSMDLRQLTRLQRLMLSIRFVGEEELFLPRTIQEISVECWPAPTEPQPHEIMRLPNLTHLAVIRPLGSLSSMARELFEPCKGQLRSLTLDHLNYDDIGILDSFFAEGYFSRLAILAITQSQTLTDDLLQVIGANCPCLSFLDCSYSIPLTGVGVKAVVTKIGRTLRRLNLRNCENVSSDAVSWARSRGVTVEFMFSDQSRKGKKVVV